MVKRCVQWCKKLPAKSTQNKYKCVQSMDSSACRSKIKCAKLKTDYKQGNSEQILTEDLGIRKIMY